MEFGCGFGAVDLYYVGRGGLEVVEDTAVAGADVEDCPGRLGEEGRDEGCAADEGGGGVGAGGDLVPVILG